MSASNNDQPSNLPPPSPVSTTSNRGSHGRQGSSASRTPSIASSQAGREREQLAQTLDLIHTSASRTNALTTFNDFASPPTQNVPVAESKGITGDLVQQGLSGLYTRIKEVVGVSSPKPNNDAEVPAPLDPAPPRRSSTSRTTPSKVSPSRVPTTTSISTMATAPSVEVTPNTAEGQSHMSQGHSVSGSRQASSSRHSLPGAAQVLAAMALDTASATALSQKDVSRTATFSDDGLGHVSGHRKSLSKANLASHLSGLETPSRDETSSLAASGDVSVSPVKSPVASSIPSSDPRAPTTATTGTNKTPAVIERITKPRSPTYARSHASSMDPSGVEASSVTPTHKSIYQNHHSRDARARSGELLVPSNRLSSDGGSEQVNVRLEKMKKQVLSKEFWMADETCKECFLCGNVFNMVRRKHHCRTCGCIFDSKCTSIISGQRFGVAGSLRVCKTCLSIINRRYDTSGSDDSADDSYLPAIFRPNSHIAHRSPRVSDTRLYTTEEDSAANSSDRHRPQYDARSGQTPMMTIPATRRIGESNRHSAVLEIDAPQLSRPSSSRSLRSMTSARPQSSGHKRHHSKHNLLGRLKGSADDRAPFRKGLNEELGRKPRFPAFHDDNIIDPELADYMSDESSADEQMSIFATMSSADLHSTSFENDKSTFGPLLSAGKKHRMHNKSVSGMSFTSRGLDDSVGVGSHIAHRASRRRNLSNVGSSMHHLRSPRPKSGVFKGPSTSSEMVFAADNPVVETTKLTRSDSLRKATTFQIELNPSSKRHVKRLLHQLLQDSDVPSVAAWEKALVPILLQCTDDVNPDVRQGDYMDIRHYVKFKKIPGGKPGDTSYVSGVIFTKNLALKSMPRRIIRPRIVIVSFPIEYQRHQQHFMSLQPVIEQEKEFLRVVVNRIVKLNPQILLAEKGVSGTALEMLANANIAVAYNVKPSVIEAVARCAEADIISSIDMLALPVRVGHCDGFEVKTFVNNSYPGKKKSYIFLSGCSPSLGCTIALRGAPTHVLASVKRITEFMVYVVYNLKLETCLMRDEFIHIPKDEFDLPSPTTSRQLTDESMKTSINTGISEHTGPGPTVVINAADSEPPSQVSMDMTVDTSEATSPTYDGSSLNDSQPHSASLQQSQTSPTTRHDHPVPEDIPMPTYYSDMVARYETKILSASPFVKFTQPYLLMRAREQERRLVYLKRLRDQDTLQDSGDTESSKGEPFELIKPELVHAIGQKPPRKLQEVIHAVHDAEYDKALHNYQTHTRQWENYIQGNINLFDPYSHQNIVVLYSVICTETKIPCEEPGLLAIGFYDEQHMDTGMDPDCTLGQYIEDLCFSKDSICASNGCDRTLQQHHRTYVHDESRITIFLEPAPESETPQMTDDITMWSYCKVCEKDSPAMPMCESTWKYSFGKYLELLFWSRGLRLNEGANCPHDHHRDHIRYFSYHDTRVRIHYDPIELLEIIVPRPRITWKVEHDLQLKNDIYTKAEERWNRFMVSVKARLTNIRIDVVLPEKAEACKAEVEMLVKKAQEDHVRLIRKMQEIYVNSKYYEVIPFNTVIREAIEVAGEWDAAFAQFEADFLPDKDVRQLTVLQLKKMFTDNESRESLPTPESISASTVESEDKPSQTFTDSDGRSTQPTDYTNPSLAESAASGQTGESGLMPEAPRSIVKADEIIDRVEPLDLATPTPITTLLEQPSPLLQVPMSPSPLVAASTPDVTSTDEPEPEEVEEASTPKAPISPTMIPRPVLEKPSSEQSLKEKVEQLKKRNQITSVDPPTARQATTDALRTPIPERVSSRRAGTNTSPPMIRAQTQPAVRQLPKASSVALSPEPPLPDEMLTKTDRKFSDRLASALKTRKGTPSSIPRLVPKKESKVSTLAKHFEQLSREFENQRIRDRKKRAEKLKQRQPRTLLPRLSTAAIVEVYDDVDAAVQEHGPSESYPKAAHVMKGKRREETRTPPSTVSPTVHVHPPASEEPPAKSTKAPEEASNAADADADVETEAGAETEAETDPVRTSQNVSEDEGSSDAEPSLEDLLPEVKAIADSLEPSSEELPKHQKTSLLKMLTNFWAERSSSGWQPLDYPVNMTDHIFMDSDIVVREDEPSSLIAFALGSEDYKAKLADIRHQWHLHIQRSGDDDDGEDNEDEDDDEEDEADEEEKVERERPRSRLAPSSVTGSLRPARTADASSVGIGGGVGPDSLDEELEKGLLRATGTHLKYQFTEGSARMTCKIFYAEQFDALRRKCGVADRIVESMSRCLKWDSRGGKTRAVFLKTLDDRFVLKSLSSVETAAFLSFAPSYFGIMAETLFHDLPSVIAKMVGFFQVIIKNPASGADIKLDLLVMENLFYDRSPGKIFDLKGSMRNRKIQSTGEQNEVLLDENMVEYIYESPLFAREHSKKLLRASVWNDTLFLARQNVMDYSLMIAIDVGRRELVVGIVDCIRTYTLDKKLESWIKDRGFAGGGRNRPTITRPKEYKSRFREAMARYILQAPNCWHQFGGPGSRSRYDSDMKLDQ